MDQEPGRGWGVVAGLAMAAMVFSVLSPGLLIFLPLSLMLLALPPRRPGLVLLGAILAGSAFAGPARDALWYFERGWALVLGAWFVFFVVAWPSARFISRALAALAAAAASAALVLARLPGGWRNLDWTLSRRVRDAAADAATVWAGAANLGDWAAQVAGSLYRVAEVQVMIQPALAALASMAALGVAWWAYRRLTVRDRAPLGSLREFRFRDDLIWVLIAGILLVVLPLGDSAVRAGSNLLAFMGALYMLRGVAVLLVLLGVHGAGGAIAAGVALFLLYPVVLTASVVLGVTDTWFDLRARRSAVRPGS